MLATLRIPPYIACAVIAVTSAPYIATALGWNAASQAISAGELVSRNLTFAQFVSAIWNVHHHAIMEWSAVAIGLLTMLIALTNYRLARNRVTLVIGMAFFCFAMMDLFNALASHNLIEAQVQADRLLPFSWTLSRSLSAIALSSGAALVFYTTIKTKSLPIKSIYIAYPLLGLVGLIAMRWASQSPNIPQTLFPNQSIARPYDLLPLVIFAASFPLYYMLHCQQQSRLTAALLLSIFPAIGSQLHMVLGSDQLFDHHFNIAYSLKTFSYLIPLFGLVAEYMRAFENETKTRKQLQKLNRELDKSVTALSKSNEQLSRFAYVCSHDLQEPLRMIKSFGYLLSEHARNSLDEEGRKYVDFMTEGAENARVLVGDILKFCRLDQDALPAQIIPLEDTIKKTRETLAHTLKEKNGQLLWGSLPHLYATPAQLYQLFLNLIQNGFKFNHSQKPRVQISAVEKPTTWQISVQDNGIGIDPAYHQKIFEIFERLNDKQQYPGTGIGLAICVKIIERHGGQLSIDSTLQNGSQFTVHWPKHDDEKSNFTYKQTR